MAMMNDIMLPFLRRFVLVFVDNILIYNSSWSAHLRHVRTLQDHQLFLKKSKCTFGQPLVAYLGHVIFEEGVAMDCHKVQPGLAATQVIARRAELPRPGMVLPPLHPRLRHDRGVAHRSVEEGRLSVVRRGGHNVPGASTCIDDNACASTFGIRSWLHCRVKCDASRMGFGEVLHQGASPIAFFSKPIAPRHAKLVAYEH
jgi:hypothetical protein